MDIFDNVIKRPSNCPKFYTTIISCKKNLQYRERQIKNSTNFNNSILYTEIDNINKIPHE